MPQMGQTDSLLDTVDEIRSMAEKQEFVLFYGWAKGDEESVVCWNEELGGDWKNFLKSARSVDAKIVYADWVQFELSQISESLKKELNTEETNVGESESAKYNQQVEKYKQYVGLTAQIHLAFQYGGIIHTCEILADWFISFVELTSEQEEEVKIGALDDQEQRAGLIEDWARKLAAHPKYRNCRSTDDREYLLKGLAGEEFSSFKNVWEILRRAETIYQFEFRDTVEQKLQEQVRTLKAQGLNINAIAQQLGISKGRVSGLIAGAKGKTPRE